MEFEMGTGRVTRQQVVAGGVNSPGEGTGELPRVEGAEATLCEETSAAGLEGRM